MRVLNVFTREHEDLSLLRCLGAAAAVRRLEPAVSPAAARAVRMRSSRTEAGSSLGSCGTSSPRKALLAARVSNARLGAGGGVAGFDVVGIGEQGLDAADDFVLLAWRWQGNWEAGHRTH